MNLVDSIFFDRWPIINKKALPSSLDYSPASLV